MDKWKRRIKRAVSVLCFWAVFLCLFGVVSEVLREKVYAQIDMIHSFYDLERDSLDVLALGSSHLYWSLSPNLLWEEHGITAYDMGNPQQSLASSYFLLKEALRYQKPKVVLLESYGFHYKTDYVSEARLRQSFDGIRLGQAKFEMVSTLLADKDIQTKLSFFVPFLKYHGRWSSLSRTDFFYPVYSKGSQCSFQKSPQTEKSIDIPAAKIPKKTKKYLKLIRELCRENGIELLVYAAPFTTGRKYYRQGMRVNIALEDYLAGQGIPFLFYQRTGELGIDFATDFLDESHLNSYGQTKLTHCIGNYLAEHYDLPGHKDDPAYASWNDDYQKYLEWVEQKKTDKNKGEKGCCLIRWNF